MIAPDSATTSPSSVMTGDLPSGCTRFSSGGASRVAGSRLIDLELVGNPEFLEQPQDALRARGLEVVDDQHGARGYLAGFSTAQASRVPPAQPFLSSDSWSQYVSGCVWTMIELPSASNTLSRPGDSVTRLVVCRACRRRP